MRGERGCGDELKVGAGRGAGSPAVPSGRPPRPPPLRGWEAARAEAGAGIRGRPPALGPRGARCGRGGGVRGPWGTPSPSPRAATQPSRALRPRPTFDASHGGDVAPGSRTRGGGSGGGGRETRDARRRRRRPDNTRKCATQYFRRRLALAQGRGGRGGLRGRAGWGLAGRPLPSRLGSSADRRPRRRSPQPVSGACRRRPALLLGWRKSHSEAPLWDPAMLLLHLLLRGGGSLDRGVMSLGENLRSSKRTHFSSRPCDKGEARLVCSWLLGFRPRTRVR